MCTDLCTLEPQPQRETVLLNVPTVAVSPCVCVFTAAQQHCLTNTAFASTAAWDFAYAECDRLYLEQVTSRHQRDGQTCPLHLQVVSSVPRLTGNRGPFQAKANNDKQALFAGSCAV